jgi:serine/threonine protein kinase
MAPECVHNKNSDTKSDVWSLGCLLYNLFTGFPPFLGKSEYLIFQKSINCKFIFPSHVVSPLAEDLISKLIVINQDNRLSIEEIYNHPFLSNEKNDKNFRNNVPGMDSNEYTFDCIRNLLKNKYDQFKFISTNLERIKQHEQMEEELKNNQINPENKEIDQELLNLLPKKQILTEELENGLKNLHSDILNYIDRIKVDFKIEDEASQEIYTHKFYFLERQILHDKFNKIYEGDD